MHRKLRILGPALALAASACWVPLEQGDLINGRLDKVEATTAEQQKRLDELQKSIEAQDAAVKDRVAAVDKKIAELNQASRRSGADLGVSVTRLQDDLAKARGDLEVEQHKLDELEQKVTDLQQSTDTRFASLRGRGALDDAEAKQLIEGLPKQDDKAALLALAQQQEQKSPGVARAIYDDYVRRFPADGSAPRAALRSGDLSAAQARWKESFVSYGWVYKNAPQSDAVPDAMLGMANAMFQLEELKADAPAMLKELVDQYPKSPAAAKAKAKLAELKKPATTTKKGAPSGGTKSSGGK
jgi:TolA-binding protein